MNKVFSVLLFLFSFATIAQDLRSVNDSVFYDDKYLEDQLYVIAAYQRLIDLPEQVSETGFSYNVGFGYIRDIPLNKARTIGLGAGIGYAFNVHYFNVSDPNDPDQPDEALKSNKIALYMAEIPIQLRFRNSTPLKYKYWRFYPGILISYAFAQNHSLKQSNDFEVKDVININNFQYGINLSVGYNNWNLYTYYGISDIFNETENVSVSFGPNEFKIGIVLFLL